MRRMIMVACALACGFALAACGHEARPPAASPSATGAARPSPAFTVVLPGVAIGSGVVGSAPSDCLASQIEAEATGPVGATAMMTLTVRLRNRGAEPCALHPREFRFDDAAGAFAAGPGEREKAAAPLLPSGAQAYVTLVWSWRGGGAGEPCARRDPDAASAVVVFADGEVRTPANVTLAPCGGRMTLLEAGVLP